MILTRQFWTYGLPVMGVILHNVAATMAKNITHDTKVFAIFLSYCNFYLSSTLHILLLACDRKHFPVLLL